VEGLRMGDDKFSRNIKESFTYKIGQDDFEIKPLEYRHLGKFWKLITKFSKFATNKDKELTPEDTVKIIEAMDEDTINLLTELEFEMMTTSYPDKTKDVIKSFVRDNMFQLMTPLMEINVPKQ
jgi:phosphorylcholine metabolism protein LicD